MWTGLSNKHAGFAETATCPCMQQHLLSTGCNQSNHPLVPWRNYTKCGHAFLLRRYAAPLAHTTLAQHNAYATERRVFVLPGPSSPASDVGSSTGQHKLLNIELCKRAAPACSLLDAWFLSAEAMWSLHTVLLCGAHTRLIGHEHLMRVHIHTPAHPHHCINNTPHTVKK